MKLMKWATVLTAVTMLSALEVTTAKELASGGGTGGVVSTCDPITSFTVRSDAKVGETGLASVQVGWGVKPCDSTQAVTVQVTIENWTTKAPIYSDLAAALDGKITVMVPSRQVYISTITVLDAVTGSVLSKKSTTVGTTPKGGV